jgi:hypothetical protein
MPSYFDMHARSDETNDRQSSDTANIHLPIPGLSALRRKPRPMPGVRRHDEKKLLDAVIHSRKSCMRSGELMICHISIRNAGNCYTNFSDYNQGQSRFISKDVDLNRQTFITALMR